MYTTASLGGEGVQTETEPCTLHRHWEERGFKQRPNHVHYSVTGRRGGSNRDRTMYTTSSLGGEGVQTETEPCTLHRHWEERGFKQRPNHVHYIVTGRRGGSNRDRTMYTTSSLGGEGVQTETEPCTLQRHWEERGFKQRPNHVHYIVTARRGGSNRDRTMYTTSSLGGEGVQTETEPCTLQRHWEERGFKQRPNHVHYIVTGRRGGSNRDRTMYTTSSLGGEGVQTETEPCTLQRHWEERGFKQRPNHVHNIVTGRRGGSNRDRTMYTTSSLRGEGVQTETEPCTLQRHWEERGFKQRPNHVHYIVTGRRGGSNRDRTMYTTSSLGGEGVQTETEPCTLQRHWEVRGFKQRPNHVHYIVTGRRGGSNRDRTMYTTSSLGGEGVQTETEPCTLQRHWEVRGFKQRPNHVHYIVTGRRGGSNRDRTMYTTASLGGEGVQTETEPCTLHRHWEERGFKQRPNHVHYSVTGR